MQESFIIALSCKDKLGIVYAVSNLLHSAGCNIQESNQFSDLKGKQASRIFHMRVKFYAPPHMSELSILRKLFSNTIEKFEMNFNIYNANSPLRVIVICDNKDHCLNDLLFKSKRGLLPIDIVYVVGNSDYSLKLSQIYNVLYINNEYMKGDDLVKQYKQHDADLIVLAGNVSLFRQKIHERMIPIISIHQSFLPSFTGDNPQIQAYNRGVKLIGATSYYLTDTSTSEIIIDQDVTRIDHATTVSELESISIDLECAVLSRAVRWHSERRVFINGSNTIIFE